MSSERFAGYKTAGQVKTAEGHTDNSLARDAMGLPDLVLTVLATLAPLTLVAAVAPLHFLVGGSAVPGGYLVAAAVMAVFAVGFTTMTRYVRNTGAFYAIISRGLGKEAGLGAAMVAVLAYNSLQISTYGALGLYAGQTLAFYTGLDVPWWVCASVALGVVAFLGARGINASSKVLACVLFAEVAVLAVMAVAVFLQGGPEAFSAEPVNPAKVLRPENGAMFALIFGAFMGFESTAIYAEEARGGAKTVRRATYVSVAFIGLFYALMTYAVVTAYGAGSIQAAAEKDPANLVLAVFEKFTSGPLVQVTNILLLLSAFAALLALHNASNRYLYALGRERIMPALFGATHPRTRAPWLAGAAQSVLALLVVIVFAALNLDPYLGLLLWGSGLGFLGIIFLWALCSVAVMFYLRRNVPEAGLWKTTIAPAVSSLALTGVLVLVFANLELLTGTAGLTNYILIGLAVLAFAGGIARALFLKNQRPGVYRNLAQPQNTES